MVHVIRPGATTEATEGSGTFTGTVWKDPLMPRADGAGMATVFFAPGARTYWHTHDGGQVLVVVSGRGLVGDRTGTHLVQQGDVVWTPGGETHWHGATPQHFMVHTAISIDGVAWHEALADHDFEAAYASIAESARAAEEAVVTGGDR